jgi:hypothetical protein
LPSIPEETVPAAPTKKRKSGAMTDAHKKALAVGREQGRVIRGYLEALESSRPKRGRKRTTDSVQRRLDAVRKELPGSTGLTRVHLIQERMDLESELANLSGQGVDVSALEGAFVKVAAEYGSRKGISYTAWREAGVDAAVLKKAGIKRG